MARAAVAAQVVLVEPQAILETPAMPEVAVAVAADQAARRVPYLAVQQQVGTPLFQRPTETY